MNGKKVFGWELAQHKKRNIQIEIEGPQSSESLSLKEVPSEQRNGAGVTYATSPAVSWEAEEGFLNH